MVAWGLVMTLMCLCKSYEGLIVARVFLGLTEAGLFPGVSTPLPALLHPALTDSKDYLLPLFMVP